MRRRVTSPRSAAQAALLALALTTASVACGPPPPEAVPEAAVAAPEPGAGLGRLADVTLSFATIDPSVPRAIELAGLVTLLLEAGLADLVEVRVHVGSVPGPPGASGALVAEMERWTATPAITAAGDEITVTLTVCDVNARCQDHSGRGPRAAPWEMTAALLRRAAFTLGRAPPPELAPDGWGATLSSDPYAVLLAGRAAAVFYGVLPAPTALGDRKRDPVVRATFLDPSMGPSWWVLARRALGLGDTAAASAAFARASLARPQSPAFLGDEAHALGLRGRWREALTVHETLAELVPGDPRFAIPHARTAAMAGAEQRAAELLDGLPTAQRGTAEELAIRVDLQAETTPPAARDALLSQWQRVAAMDPEPVRRRVRLAVQTQRYDHAMGLANVLRERGEPTEADALLVALGAATGSYRQAAEAAARLGLHDLEVQLAQRESGTVPSEIEAPPRPRRVRAGS